MLAMLRRRFWVEIVSRTLTVVLAVVTTISREWIELAFGVDPDGGSGALEWGIVISMFVTTAAFWTLAGVEWRRAKAKFAT